MFYQIENGWRVIYSDYIFGISKSKKKIMSIECGKKKKPNMIHNDGISFFISIQLNYKCLALEISTSSSIILASCLSKRKKKMKFQELPFNFRFLLELLIALRRFWSILRTYSFFLKCFFFNSHLLKCIKFFLCKKSSLTKSKMWSIEGGFFF